MISWILSHLRLRVKIAETYSESGYRHQYIAVRKLNGSWVLHEKHWGHDVWEPGWYYLGTVRICEHCATELHVDCTCIDPKELEHETLADVRAFYAIQKLQKG